MGLKCRAGSLARLGDVVGGRNSSSNFNLCELLSCGPNDAFFKDGYLVVLAFFNNGEAVAHYLPFHAWVVLFFWQICNDVASQSEYDIKLRIITSALKRYTMPYCIRSVISMSYLATSVLMLVTKEILPSYCTSPFLLHQETPDHYPAQLSFYAAFYYFYKSPRCAKELPTSTPHLRFKKPLKLFQRPQEAIKR